MGSKVRIFLIAIPCLLSVVVANSLIHADDAINNDRVILITLAEALQPNAKIVRGMFDDEEPSDGPTIVFHKPTPDTEVQKPVPIEITFKENKAPVDLNSLEVTYLKLFSIDITDRVKPYATNSGIMIEKADLPSGTHKVKFSIKDTQNQLTERTLKITILDDSEES